MHWIIWTIIMVPVSALFTGIGIYAWKRSEPMWFWSGTEVKKEEISDVPAYNRANGIMWICFSAVLWTSTVLGFLRMKWGGYCLIGGCIIGLPALIFAYGRIYARYRNKP